MTGRRMAVEDSFWLTLDRPENPMVVTSLLWTTVEVDPDRFRALVRARLLDPHPVLRQRPVVHGGPLRWASWVDDAAFDLDRHLVVAPAPEGGSRAALQRFVGEQRSTPLDPAHPMWRIHLLQGYQGGSAMVVRMHHSIADGIRSTQLLLGLLDAPDGHPPELSARVGRPDILHPLPGRRVGPVATLLNTAVGVLTVGLWTNPRSALEGHPGIAKAVAWSDPLPLPALKAVAKKTGTTVNDVCTALVCGALARHLAQVPGTRPPAPADDRIAWMVPVNLQPADQQPRAELGNHFALVLVPLPHGPAGFRDRLRDVHRAVSRIRDSWEPEVTYALSRTIALSPTPVGTLVNRFFGAKAVGVLTNVPGPRTTMDLAGAPVAGVVGWAPTSMNQALTVTIFSYAGQVTIGFGTDPAVVPDADALVTALHAEFGQALVEVGVPGSDQAAGGSEGDAASPAPNTTIQSTTG
ncbi:acyltransferase, WS/DGAT/MGAT [Blastococcus aggregatus]|uniref:diacylglycerol O-acyltransferase n=1 Tax=Blastococcus aggregatus TaxID=38502 RepID=A0A285V634_9ACTN|nr:WS/DGAT domain-containing protein [Blastococcus aggregatus]SOC49575.1 acyltransferase, WS/DGAT/MGAT [Blastococcus aggregatus]